MKAKIYSLLLLLIFSIQSQAVVTTLKDSASNYKLFNNELEIFMDVDGKMTFEDILKSPDKFSRFSPSDCYSKHSSFIYWIRFPLQDSSGDENKWVFEILDSRFDEVIFYTPDLHHPGEYKSSKTGIEHAYTTRQYGHKNFIFDLPLIQDGKPHYYYMRIKPGVVGSFLFKISKNKVFATYAFREYIMLGMYYGVLLIMAFYNLFIYFSIREKVYLYYSMFAFAWAFNSTLDDSLGFQYIWSDFPVVTRFGSYISKILVIGFYLLYSQSFLSSRDYTENKKMFYRLLFFFILTSFVLIYLDMIMVYNIIFTVIFAFISYQSYMVYRQGYRPARFFLIGNAIIVLGLIIYLVKSTGAFTTFIDRYPMLHIFLVYIKNVIMVIDIVVLSIALGDRMRFLKTTAELAQQEAYNQLNEKKLLSEKVNRELEQKVAERTKELEEQKQLLVHANSKLQEQAEEINKMNALLDLDNWNLKKNIIQEKEARIIDKEINFEEFQQVYPDDMSCYRFIDEIKQDHGFTCHKCGSRKFGKGLTTFSRRCLDCRYDESVTAYTVFHGCKFKIQIAMYIVVMINRYGKTIPITEISREVKLRNGTCTKFAQKLLSTRESKEYMKKNEKDRIKMLILESVKV